MEPGASVKDQSDLEMTIKVEMAAAAPSTEYVEIEININNLKQEPGSENEPASLVKEEVLEDSKHDDNERQYHGPSTSTGTGSMNAALSTSLDNFLYVKHEPRDVDIGATMLQHMDINYGIYQNTSDVSEENTFVYDYNEAVACSRVKESVEDKLRDLKDGNYRCDKCMKIFRLKSKLNRHCQNIHGTECYKCTECNREFKCMLYLQKHVNNMHSNKQYECDICKTIFKMKQAVKRHILRLHSGKLPATGQLHTCDLCQKTFCIKRVARDQIYTAHGAGAPRCPKCKKNRKCNRYLQQNEKLINDTDPDAEIYMCDLCQKKFWTRRGIREHITTTHGDGMHRCLTCNRNFKCRRYLQQHERIHATGPDAQIFKCDLCQKIYMTKRAIREHVKSVHGALIHQCSKCNKTYKCRSYLQQHKKKVHSEVKHKCEVCLRFFKTTFKLMRHCKKVHNSKKI